MPTPKRFTLATGSLLAALLSQAGAEQLALLDSSLSHFEIWMGAPHVSVQGFPEGTVQVANVTKEGIPLDLNNDPQKVFSIIGEAGEPVLRITEFPEWIRSRIRLKGE